jgi:hypothetical protein
MDMLLTFVMPVLLFVVLEIVWCRPAWLRSPGDGFRDGERGFSPSLLAPDDDPFTLSFVRHRLDVLAAELKHLENDSEIFAKAFRTHVVKAAYQALLEDADRLANASRLAAITRLSDTTIVDVEIWNSQAPLREELEV